MNKIESYKKLLPETLSVKIHRGDGNRLVAEITNFPHCFTQAKDYDELIPMVNDVVYTYLEIPIKHMKELGYYVPQWQKKILEALSKKPGTPKLSPHRIEDFILTNKS